MGTASPRTAVGRMGSLEPHRSVLRLKSTEATSASASYLDVVAGFWFSLASGAYFQAQNTTGVATRYCECFQADTRLPYWHTAQMGKQDHTHLQTPTGDGHVQRAKDFHTATTYLFASQAPSHWSLQRLRSLQTLDPRDCTHQLGSVGASFGCLTAVKLSLMSMRQHAQGTGVTG